MCVQHPCFNFKFDKAACEEMNTQSLDMRYAAKPDEEQKTDVS